MWIIYPDVYRRFVIWQAKREQEALAAVEQALLQLSDPRREQGKRYPLRSVVVISLMAMVCGADDAEGIQAWGETNLKWLRTFLLLPHGARLLGQAFAETQGG